MKLGKRMYGIVLEMIKERGYTILSQKYDPLNEDDQTEHIVARNTQNEKVYIYLKVIPNLSLEIFNSMVKKVPVQVKHIIIIMGKKTSAVKETDQVVHVELINSERLLINPNKLLKAPAFVKLNQREIDEFKADYKVQFISRLLCTDAICIFNGYTRGDIIKITDKSGYVNYKIVKGPVIHKPILNKEEEKEDAETEDDEDAEEEEDGEGDAEEDEADEEDAEGDEDEEGEDEEGEEVEIEEMGDDEEENEEAEEEEYDEDDY